MAAPPFVSVIMSVYNGEKYLAKAIEGILLQTYNDFEFIIVDDGSDDSSASIISRYAGIDSRIIFLRHENRGLAYSLNKAVKVSKGEYIARQDADDYSLPERLEKQISFLIKSPECVLCGTWFEEINENNGKKIRRFPFADTALRKNILYLNQFCHPSVIFQKAAFTRAGGYDERLQTGQDFELWMRLQTYGKIANIPKVLLRRRIGFSKTISWEKRNQKYQLWKVIYKKHFHSWNNVNILKFIYFYLPLLTYQFIPISIIKIIRHLRYRK